MKDKVNFANNTNNRTSNYYDFLFTDLADPRTNNWPLIGSPLPGLVIVILYVFFVLKWGPKYMENRKPFELRRVIIIYNFLQIVISLYISIKACKFWLFRYSWKCQPIDYTKTPEAIEVASLCYVYFIAKLTELLDTIFFVLRKKNNQLSFLHIYHHTVMPIVGWGATKYFPGGHGTFIGFVNSWIHVFMYTYYYLAAFGPKYQKYLWWKKYITRLQLLQFCCTFLHNMQLLFYDCGYPRWTVLITLPNSIFFYMLFMDFYNDAYSKKNKKLITENKKEIKEKSS